MSRLDFSSLLRGHCRCSFLFFLIEGGRFVVFFLLEAEVAAEHDIELDGGLHER